MLTYTPQSPDQGGFAIAAGRRVALLSADASGDTALALHRLLSQQGLPLSAALELLRESTVCKRFAVVELAPSGAPHARIALRGDVRVDLGSASMSRFEWPEGATWVTAMAEGIALMRLSLGDVPADAPHLPLLEGVVHASDLVVSPADASADAGEEGGDEDTDLTVLLDSTVVKARAAEQARMEQRLLGTQVTAPVEQPHDVRPSRTPQRVDLSSLMAPAAWTLRLPDGNELTAGGSIVVGRRPWRSDPDETSTYYIVAPSPGKQISGKHLEFSVVGHELRARDLESTNGTLVLTPDRPPRLLTAGRSVTLDTGDTLDLGEGFQIVVGERR